MSETVITVIALIVGLVACITDVRTRRIPNVLTFGAAAAAILVHGIVDGASGVGMSVAGWLVGTALFLPFFLLRGMGAGDVKLLAALGAWVGPRETFWIAVYGSLAGGVMALALALSRGYLRTAFRNLRSMVTFWVLVGPRPMPEMTLERGEGPRLAYAIPIFAGALVAVWLR